MAPLPDATAAPSVNHKESEPIPSNIDSGAPALVDEIDGEGVTIIGSGPQDGVKMYFVVDAGLKMGRGKIAGQVAHATADWTRRLEKNKTEAYKLWLANHEPKIVLKGTGEMLRLLRAKCGHQTVAVHDMGCTQIPANSLTVVAFAPAFPADLPPEISQLRLL